MAGKNTLVTFIIIVYAFNLLWSLLILFSLTGWFTRGKKDYKIDELRQQVMDLQKSMDNITWERADIVDNAGRYKDEYKHKKDELSEATKTRNKKWYTYYDETLLLFPEKLNDLNKDTIDKIKELNQGSYQKVRNTRRNIHKDSFEWYDLVLKRHQKINEPYYKLKNKDYKFTQQQARNVRTERDKYKLLYNRQTELLNRMLGAVAPRPQLNRDEFYGMFLVSFLLNLVLLALVSSLASDDKFTPWQKSNGKAIQAMIGILCVSDLLIGLFITIDSPYVKWPCALLNLATTIAYGVYAGVVYYRH